MKSYHKNPRKISEAELLKLRENIIELGDISGIVHDIDTDEIISGNQRSKVIDIEQCEVVILEDLNEPDQWGTLRSGYILWEGIKMNYRQVKWTKAQCEKANITANTFGGEFDTDILFSAWKDVNGIENWNIPVVFDMPVFVDNTLDHGIATSNKHFHGSAKVFLSINLLQRPIRMDESLAKPFLDKMKIISTLDEKIIEQLYYRIFKRVEVEVNETIKKNEK